MRLFVCTAAALALVSTSAAASPAFQLHETTWTFVDNKMKVRESIDAGGNYIENAVGGKHIDHGTAVMKDGKACFTSAMTKDGEVCWTDPHVTVGQSGETTSDKREKLVVKEVAYVPLTMAK
jgi:hypothetical protein